MSSIVQHIDGGVARRDDLATFDVGTDHVGNGSVGVHMVGSILCVVFDNKNQGVVLVLAVGDLLDDLPQGIVIVGHLSLDCVDAIDCASTPRPCVAEVVMRQSDQLCTVRVGSWFAT